VSTHTFVPAGMAIEIRPDTVSASTSLAVAIVMSILPLAQ
jgi:hypothetical protein